MAFEDHYCSARAEIPNSTYCVAATSENEGAIGVEGTCHEVCRVAWLVEDCLLCFEGGEGPCRVEGCCCKVLLIWVDCSFEDSLSVGLESVDWSLLVDVPKEDFAVATAGYKVEFCAG